MSVVQRFGDWGRRHEIKITLLVLLGLFAFAFFWPQIVIPIRPGHRGVLWSRFTGTHLDRVYPEGTHLIFPWDEMTVYPIRYATTDRTIVALSKDGLPISVDVTMRYKPAEKLLPYLHQGVGPQYVDTIVVPEVASALRGVIGDFRPEELYAQSFESIQERIVGEAKHQTGIRFVMLDDVLITKVTLPDSVTAAIQNKLSQEQAALEMNFRIQRETDEAKRKEIEGEGVRTFQRLISETMSDRTLQYKGIEATLELARSNNAKVVVIGSGNGNMLPLILNTDGTTTPTRAPAPR
jgi:regulator of protease activity HflC (stomatin/prohibitin superfamily)